MFDDSAISLVTDKNLLFGGSAKKFKTRLNKLIPCELMSDGIWRVL